MRAGWEQKAKMVGSEQKLPDDGHPVIL